MDVNKLKTDKILLEKIILAYWYSIPGDGDIHPTESKIRYDNKYYYNVDLYNNKVMMGTCSIMKFEIDRYLEKLRTLKVHELDIINRIENEVTTKQSFKNVSEHNYVEEIK